MAHSPGCDDTATRRFYWMTASHDEQRFQRTNEPQESAASHVSTNLGFYLS